MQDTLPFFSGHPPDIIVNWSFEKSVFKCFEMQHTQHEHCYELDNDNGHIAWLHIIKPNQFAFIGCLLIYFAINSMSLLGKFSIFNYVTMILTAAQRKFQNTFSGKSLRYGMAYWKWFPFFWPNAFLVFSSEYQRHFRNEAYQNCDIF